MKRIITILSIAAALTAAALTVSAAPANPNPITYTQPDGTTITIQLHGDEFYHWVTDGNGNEIELDEDGFYRIVTAPLTPKMKSQASAESSRRFAAAEPSGIQTKGDVRFPVLLIEFQDLTFTVSDTRQTFSDMLNSPGYNLNGAIGSAVDYFEDNSLNTFHPTFDVYGPVKVSGNYAYYGQGDSDKYTGRALIEAAAQLDDQIDFSKYDNDNDGKVDMVFFFFAGHNAAEGATNDHIWPHKWNLASYFVINDSSASSTKVPGTNSTYRNIRFDGKSLDMYACTSEYRGDSGKNRSGIGTFCHEFSHVLGLPDFYDTDYEDHGRGDGLLTYSLMSNGAYNSNGCIPPYMTSIERGMLGWMGEPALLESGKSYTLYGVQNNECYKTKTATGNEYFLYEARVKDKWDSPLPEGLVIYHVDSDMKWNNCDESHPAVYFKAARPTSLNPPKCAEKYIPYPGDAKQNSFDNFSLSPATDWAGHWNGDRLTNIKCSSHKVTFNYLKEDRKGVFGTVTDLASNELLTDADIEVTFSGGQRTAKTGSSGTYEIDLKGTTAQSFIVTAGKTGYGVSEQTFSLAAGSMEKNFKLAPEVPEKGLLFKKYRSTSSITGARTGSFTMMAGIRYTGEELKPYAGSSITSITFRIKAAGSSTKAVIYFGSSLIFQETVTSPAINANTSVKISEEVKIPNNLKDDDFLIVGYILEGIKSGDYPIVFDNTTHSPNGLVMRSSDTASWIDYGMQFGTGLISFNIGGGDNDKMHTLGYSGLKLEPGKVYSVNEQIPLSMVASSDSITEVSYYMDGEDVDSKSDDNTYSVTPKTAGDHEIKAVVTYASGKKETIIQIIKVE